MDYITILEYIGVFAFAVSGAIVAIEEEFDIEIPNEEAEKISTVADAVEQIKNALN